MKTGHFIVTVLTLVTISVAATPHAHATSGTLTVSTSDLTLTEDHYGQITFASNATNRTLDCNGFSVIFSNPNTPNNCGTNNNVQCGIRVFGVSGVTIQNCAVTGSYGYGVWIADSSQPYVYATQSNGASVGFRYDSVYGGSHDFSDARDNLTEGLEIRNSILMNVYDTFLYYNGGDGGDEEHSDNSYYSTNESFDNGTNGLECDGCRWEEYYGNNVYGNDRHGITVDDDMFTGANNFWIYYNFTGYNAESGIRVQDANNGNVRWNESTGHFCDLEQDGSSTGNTWSQNTYTYVASCGVPFH